MSVGEINALLNIVVLQLGDRSITLMQVLSVPALLILGFLLIRWGGRLIARRLERSTVNPDLVHLIRRIFYILAIALLICTLSTIAPSWWAARMLPVDGLRYE